MAKRIIFIATQLFAVFLIIFSLYELYQLGSTMLIGSRHSSSSIQPTEGGSWETLRDVNPDIIGWLTIEGTGVDFPILQDRELHRVFKETGGLPASYLSSHAEKTREEIVFKYLFYDFKGEPSETGSITIDFRNSLEDPYIIIYGHNVGLPGVMFSDLKQFEKESFFDAHRSASITSEAGEMKLRLLMSALVSGYSGEVYGHYVADPYVIDIPGAVEHISKNKLLGEPAEYDLYVLLSTCYNDPSDPLRLVLLYGVED